ncbi:MFS transporter [Demequina globuliformis]|uniref:MFS transporter n=1 Tax=Demequina globuliformis TaxID=676202 RepID=UPI000785A010|nr:MFS transporter [Demequina globuliformis]
MPTDDHPLPRAAATAAAHTGDATWVPSPSDHRPQARGHGPSWTPVTTPRRARATLVVMACAAFALVTNEIAPLGLIRSMAVDLNQSESTIGLLTTGFAVTVMVATVPLTLLTTRLDRRAVLVGVMAFWSLGALVIALSDSFALVMTGRVMTALGHALFWAVATPAAAGLFAPHLRGRSVTRLMLGGATAGVVGLPLATVLGQRTSWQVPFWILAALGIAVALAIAVLMPSFRTSEGSVARGDVPSLPRFIRVLVVVLLTCTATATTWTYIAPFYVDVAGFSEESVPALLALAGASGMVSMYAVGRFLDRWPVKSLAVGEGLLLLLWCGLATMGHMPVVAIVMLVVQGLAWSTAVAAMANWALRHTPWSSDIGMSAQASTFNAGNALGSALGAGILAWWGAQWLPVASALITAVVAVLVWQVAPEATRLLHRRARTPEARRRAASRGTIS